MNTEEGYDQTERVFSRTLRSVLIVPSSVFIVRLLSSSVPLVTHDAPRPTLSVTRGLLLGPGPSDAHPRVLTAMTTPLLGHLDPQFLEIMNETQAMLSRRCTVTKNQVHVPGVGDGHGRNGNVSGEPASNRATRSSSATMGYFGNRMVDIAGRTGAARQLTAERSPVGPRRSTSSSFAKRCKSVRPKVLAIWFTPKLRPGRCKTISEVGKLCARVRRALGRGLR